jgi:hypothetical protein
VSHLASAGCRVSHLASGGCGVHRMLALAGEHKQVATSGQRDPLCSRFGLSYRRRLDSMRARTSPRLCHGCSWMRACAASACGGWRFPPPVVAQATSRAGPLPS